VAVIFTFAFRVVISGSLSTVEQKQSFTISVFGAERMYFVHSVFLNYLSTVAWQS